MPGLTTAAMRGGAVNIDELRYGIERMPPAQYLAASYYERHLFTTELNLVDKGVLTRNDIDQRVTLLLRDPSAAQRRDRPELAREFVKARLHSELPQSADGSQAGFQPGDAVVARNIHRVGHTRLPRYVRGKRGVIDRFHGVEPLPDASAQGRGPAPEPLYSVRFAVAALWGTAVEGPGSVYVDLWESYLEPLREDRP
jgi:nitrile hydratase beta subunit